MINSMIRTALGAFLTLFLSFALHSNVCAQKPASSLTLLREDERRELTPEATGFWGDILKTYRDYRHYSKLVENEKDRSTLRFQKAQELVNTLLGRYPTDYPNWKPVQPWFGAPYWYIEDLYTAYLTFPLHAHTHDADFLSRAQYLQYRTDIISAIWAEVAQGNFPDNATHREYVDAHNILALAKLIKTETRFRATLDGRKAGVRLINEYLELTLQMADAFMELAGDHLSEKERARHSEIVEEIKQLQPPSLIERDADQEPTDAEVLLQVFGALVAEFQKSYAKKHFFEIEELLIYYLESAMQMIPSERVTP